MADCSGCCGTCLAAAVAAEPTGGIVVTPRWCARITSVLPHLVFVVCVRASVCLRACVLRVFCLACVVVACPLLFRSEFFGFAFVS